MKSQFVFQGKTYFAESKKQAASFLLYWDGFFSKILPLETTLKIKGVERSPGWVHTSIEQQKKEGLRKEFVKSFWVSPNGNVAVTKVDDFVDWFYSKLQQRDRQIEELKKKYEPHS